MTQLTAIFAPRQTTGEHRSSVLACGRDNGHHIVPPTHTKNTNTHRPGQTGRRHSQGAFTMQHLAVRTGTGRTARQEMLSYILTHTYTIRQPTSLRFCIACRHLVAPARAGTCNRSCPCAAWATGWLTALCHPHNPQAHHEVTVLPVRARTCTHHTVTISCQRSHTLVAPMCVPLAGPAKPLHAADCTTACVHTLHSPHACLYCTADQSRLHKNLAPGLVAVAAAVDACLARSTQLH